ncbi:MAG TPA: ABC transporter substrate-binding protein, partial [Anaerolineae bacterium]|nr:ABC transporter substrate-binding protein [Anaerolineae bacterium]
PVSHPARFLRLSQSANQFRPVFEYLTVTNRDNITQPYMLDSWSTSDDLTTWTLNLRQNITWTNGDPFTAEHVKFNFEQWLDPNIGSSIASSWAGFLTPAGVEVVDDYTVRLNLDQPLLAVPEIMSDYPSMVIHPSFDGDISSGDNPSTGPYTLDEYVLGSHARVVRRDDYWQVGQDGQPLPYLDAIEWRDLGPDQAEWISALTSGQVDTMFSPNIETVRTLQGNDNFYVLTTGTAQARVLRFQVDREPWTDNRYVQAVKMCQDRQEIMNIAGLGQGLLGYDTHVSPVHPEFAPMEVPEFNPAAARVLLESIGGREGRRLSLELTYGDSEPDTVAFAELLKENAAKAGITIILNPMPTSEYLSPSDEYPEGVWLGVPVGITPWAHRPLAVQVLPLAYTAGAVWNESHWVNEEFSNLLQQAQGTLDIEARRSIMAELQRIQSEEGSIGISWWLSSFAVINPGFQNVEAHPANYALWNEVWYDPARDPLT